MKSKPGFIKWWHIVILIAGIIAFLSTTEIVKGYIMQDKTLQDCHEALQEKLVYKLRDGREVLYSF